MKSSTKINLAINNWTSSNNLAFMKIIDYFIDHEWRFRKILLIFKHFLNSHIEKSMSRKVMNILKNYEFERRLLNLTNDNASNNDKMRRFVRKILLKNDIEWNHEKNHVSCLTHVIQLTMNELLKSLKIFVINDIVNSVFKKAFVIHIANDLSLSTTLFKMCIFHRFFSQNKCLN
jgi:hypothetical protein